MNRKNQYKDLDRWRATANEQRKRNYRRGNFGDGGKRRYTQAELEMIEAHEISDRELAKKLRRSVQAIQITRWRIKSIK